MNRLSDLNRRLGATALPRHVRAGASVVAPHLHKPVLLLIVLAVALGGLTLTTGPQAFGGGNEVPKDAVHNDHVKNFYLADIDGINGTGEHADRNDDRALTNDEIQYQVNMTTKRAIKDPVLTLTVPAGLEITTITGECIGATAEPAAPAPGTDAEGNWVGITPTSWKSLPSQTVECRLSQALSVDQPYIFPFAAKVRSEVPNGTRLEGAQVVLTEGQSTLATSNKLGVTVVSSPQHHVQIGARDTNSQTTCGAVNADNVGTPGVLGGRPYYSLRCAMSISVPKNALGTEPIKGNYTFDLNLNPNDVYPMTDGVQTTDLPAYKANGWAKYRPEFEVNLAPNHTPGTVIKPGSTIDTPQNSVRRSANVLKSELVSDTTWRVTLDGSTGDLSGYTCPSENRSSSNALPEDRCFVGTYGLNIMIPYDAIAELGRDARKQAKAGNTTGWKQLDSGLVLMGIGVKRDVTAISLSGQTNKPWTTDTTFRSSYARIESAGTWNAGLGGMPGDTGNAPIGWWSGAAVEGPPGSLTKADGEGRIVPDQVVVNQVRHIQVYGGRDLTGLAADAACTVFDPRLNLTAPPGSAYQRPASGPGSTTDMIRASDTPTSGSITTHGKNQPVWLNDYTIRSGSTSGPVVREGKDSPAGYFDLKIQYATVPYDADPAKSGDVGSCTAAPGSVWYDDPAKVPGNDPAKLKKGIYTAPNAVRVLYINKRLDTAVSNAAVSMALTRDDDARHGDALGVRQHYLTGNDTVSSGPRHWPGKKDLTWAEAAPLLEAKTSHESVYNPGKTIADEQTGFSKASPSGSGGSMYGNRVISAGITPSVTFGVRQDGSGEEVPYTDKTMTIAAGQMIEAQVMPQLVSPIVTNRSFNYRAELCLPAGLTMRTNTASVVPSAEIRNGGAKATTLECAASDTLYQWDLGFLSTPHADLATCTNLPEDTSRLETSDLDLMENEYGCRIVGAVEPITMKLFLSPVAQDGTIELRSSSQIIGEPVNKRSFKKVQLSVLSSKTSGVTVDTYGSSLLDVNPFPDSPKPVQGGFTLGYFNRGLTGGGIVHGVEISGILPVNGQAGSAFNGTLKYTGHKIMVGDASKIRLLYSTDRVMMDPTSQKVVKLDGTDPKWGPLPADRSKVTAVHYFYDKPVEQDEQVQVAFTYEVAENRTGNNYEMQATGLSETFHQRHIRDASQTVKGGSIGDLVWADNNENGVQDLARLDDMLDSEHGVGGIPVTIEGTTARGKALPKGTTTTLDAGLRHMATGSYFFDNLPEGEYTIKLDMGSNGVAKSKGYTGMTAFRQGADEGRDSDLQANGSSYTIALAKHQDLNSIDAGLVGKAEVTITRYGEDAKRDYAWAGGGYSMGTYLENTGTIPLQEVEFTDTTTGHVKSVDGLGQDKTTGGSLTAQDEEKEIAWEGELRAGERQAFRSDFTLLDPRTVHDQVVVKKDASYGSMTTTSSVSGSWAGGAADVYCTAPSGLGRVQVIDDNRKVPGVEMAEACSITKPVAFALVESSVDFADHGSSTMNLNGTMPVWNETAGDGRFGPGEKMSGTATLKNLSNVPVQIDAAAFVFPDEREGKARSFSDASTVDMSKCLTSGVVRIPVGGSCTFTLKPQLIDQTMVDERHGTTGKGDEFLGRFDYRLAGVETKGLITSTAEDGGPTFHAESVETYHRAEGLTLVRGSLSEVSGNGVLEPGEDLLASYTLINTGNLTITEPSVEDGLGGTLTAETDFDGTLAPGESVTLAKRVTPPGEGDLRVVATATGRLPMPDDSFADAEFSSLTMGLDVAARAESGLDLKVELKDASGDGVLTVGEEYTYDVLITNSGADTLSGVQLRGEGSPAVPSWTVTSGTGVKGTTVSELAPGQSVGWQTGPMKATVAGPPDHTFHATSTGSDDEPADSNVAHHDQEVFTGPLLAPQKAG